MITPVNGHLLIEPVEHRQFIATDQGTYEEIGVVLAFDEQINNAVTSIEGTVVHYVKEQAALSVGDRVYFDAWLAAKFPSEKKGEHYWLVKWEHIRAIEHVKGQVSE